MDGNRFIPLSRAFIGLASLLAVCAVQAQKTNTAEEPAPSSEEEIVMSPFVVSSEKDTGYAATDTLAGTRLRTSLKDIAASVSVVTKELMEDLALSGTADMLVYTTGTEVVGVGGNYSG